MSFLDPLGRRRRRRLARAAVPAPRLAATLPVPGEFVPGARGAGR
jgi:hypothetical protein